MTRWELYVDESGKFDARGDDVVVAGILLRPDVPGLASHEITEAIAQTLPHVPWPPHAAHVQHPISSVVWYEALHAGSSKSRRRESRQLLSDERAMRVQKTTSILQHHAKELFGRAVEEVRSSSKPSPSNFDELKELENIIQNNASTLLMQLKIDANEDGRKLSQLMLNIARTALDTQDMSMFLVGCGESWCGDAWGAQPDRYLAMLSVFIERAAGVLLRFGKTCQLDVYVSQRYVYDTFLKKVVPMNQSHLTKAIQSKLGEQRFIQNTDASVKINPCGIIDYDNNVAGPFVLADFVANRFRHVLKSTTRLSQIHDIVQQTFYAPVCSRPTNHSHLAAATTVSTWLRKAQEERWSEETWRQTMQNGIGGIRPRLWAIEQGCGWL